MKFEATTMPAGSFQDRSQAEIRYLGLIETTINQLSTLEKTGAFGAGKTADAVADLSGLTYHPTFVTVAAFTNVWGNWVTNACNDATLNVAIVEAKVNEILAKLRTAGIMGS